MMAVASRPVAAASRPRRIRRGDRAALAAMARYSWPPSATRCHKPVRAPAARERCGQAAAGSVEALDRAVDAEGDLAVGERLEARRRPVVEAETPTLSVPSISGWPGSIQIGTDTTCRTPFGCGQKNAISCPAAALATPGIAANDADAPTSGEAISASTRPCLSVTTKQVGGRAAADTRSAIGCTVAGSPGVDRGLEPRQVRDQPRLAREVLDENVLVLLDQRAGLVEPALQLALRLRGRRRG